MKYNIIVKEGGEAVNYQFEWYNRKVGVPIVSVASYGLTFNSGAAEAMGRPAYIKLGFDRNNLVIGVMPVHDIRENDQLCFPFTDRKGYVRINNKDFIRHISTLLPNGIPNAAKRVYAHWCQEQGVLIVDLKQLDSNISDDGSEGKEKDTE